MSDVAAIIEFFEAKFDAIEARQQIKTDVILRSLHHIISTRKTEMDHDALLALAEQISGKTDDALSAAEALNASHDVKTVALDDIGTVLTSIGPKLDQIIALKPAAAAPDAPIDPSATH